MGCRFTSRGGAVMATRTSANHRGVIDACRRIPNHAAMTQLATVVGGNMCRRFARCSSAIVATETCTGDIDVIEIRGRPRSGGVA